MSAVPHHLAAAQRMVDHQLRARGIDDERVLAALLAIPRHRFVPHVDVDEAYADKALPTASGQTISQPYIVALMSSLLDVRAGHRVLEIGTGSGYQTAVLVALGARVVTMEAVPGLSHFAQRLLGELGMAEQVKFVVGDGTLGCPADAPYDRILVTASAPHVPRALEEQLLPGGRIVIPLGSRVEQTLFVVHRDDQGRTWMERSIECRFVPLIGKDGWPAGVA